MAVQHWAVDPTIANEDNSEARATLALAETTPFKFWASVTWVADDKYWQKRTTSNPTDVVIVPPGGVVTIDAYGTGAKPQNRKGNGSWNDVPDSGDSDHLIINNFDTGQVRLRGTGIFSADNTDFNNDGAGPAVHMSGEQPYNSAGGTVRNCDFTNGNSLFQHEGGLSNYLFEDCTLHDPVGNDGFAWKAQVTQGESGTGNMARRCVFTSFGSVSEQCVDVLEGQDHSTMEDCTLDVPDVPDECIHAAGPDWLINRCFLKNCASGINFELRNGVSADDGVVKATLMFNCNSLAGLGADRGHIRITGTDNTQLYNNTIIAGPDSQATTRLVQWRNSVTNGKQKNNIFLSDEGANSPRIIILSGGLTSDFNSYYIPDRQADGAWDGSDTFTIWKGRGFDASGIEGDPLLVGTDFTTTAAFKLQATSPAVGAGVAITGVDNDYFDKAFVDPPSIGGVEGEGMTVVVGLVTETDVAMSVTVVSTSFPVELVTETDLSQPIVALGGAGPIASSITPQTAHLPWR